MANTSNLTLDNVACAADIYAGRILYKGPILQNAGVIRVTAGARFLQFSESTTLTGGGEMRLANGTVGTTGTPLPVTITQEPDHRLFGSGTIGVSFINNGLIEADQSFQSLRFLGQPLVNNGVIRATNGGVFERAFGGASGAGEWIADGGTIKGTSSQPDVNLIGPTRVIHGGFLGAFGLGGWSASDLTIDATSSMHVTARLALSGNYLFEQADESKITWNAGANLIMSGGSGASCSSASWATLEVGGSDDGVGGNGTGNFGMENIIVTENAAVALSDFADNGNRGGLSGTAEALYATSLTLEAGAILNLNGLHIYVGGVERDPGPFGDGLIVDEPIHRAGDMNCDGSLNGLDVAAFVVAALTPGDYPTQFPNCNLCTGDLDGDGQSATIEDIPLFVDALLIAQAL
ncbi:MAG: hypothetical protein IPK83_21785 [Planctomycetes bacterium]|nr:hypothetical protein [Planctomycetota bacterium]